MMMDPADRQCYLDEFLDGDGTAVSLSTLQAHKAAAALDVHRLYVASGPR